MQFFWLFFWAASPSSCFTLKQRSRIMVGLEHPTFRLRGGDVTTSPPLPIDCFVVLKMIVNCLLLYQTFIFIIVVLVAYIQTNSENTEQNDFQLIASTVFFLGSFEA